MTVVKISKARTNPPEIRQGDIRRDWMDETYKKHAYQCLPLTVANTTGWEILLKEELVVQWDGGNSVPKILSGEKTEDGFTQAQQSIVGMVSFMLGWVIKTEEPYSVWISGSPNYFIDGAAPLTATIPTWWWPDEFQMNWKITKIGEPVIFQKGTPICFFTIADNSLLERVKFEEFSPWGDEEFVKSRIKYGEEKIKKAQNWTWSKGIRTGVDADLNKIGPTFTGMPKLDVPNNNK